MDIATLIGLVAGWGLVIWGILMGSSIMIFYDAPSMAIVGGGTFAAGLIAYPMREVFSTFKFIKKTFFQKFLKVDTLIPVMVEMSQKARKEGLLALETVVEQVNDPFMARGIQMVVDGHEVDDVETIMSTEVDMLRERHKKGAEILEKLGNFAPALGMIGTLIGLVQMLRNMSDPSVIGPAMAVALITTFYGSMMANLIFLPMATKLRHWDGEEAQVKEMIITGILAISNGDNPRIVERKLNAYLPPKEQKSVFDQADKDKK